MMSMYGSGQHSYVMLCRTPGASVDRTKNKKVSFYIAQYPVHRTAQSDFTLYFPGRPVQSNTISISLAIIVDNNRQSNLRNYFM